MSISVLLFQNLDIGIAPTFQNLDLGIASTDDNFKSLFLDLVNRNVYERKKFIKIFRKVQEIEPFSEFRSRQSLD